MEDTSPYLVLDMIEQTDKEGVLPKVVDVFSGDEVEWDYRDLI